MERLLRQTGVPAGLLFNGRTLRLVSAPRGESSGWLDFRVADMVQTAGRPICHCDAAAPRAAATAEPAARRSASPRSSRTAASSRTRSASGSPSRCSTRSTSCSAASRRRTTQSKGELLATAARRASGQVYRALLTVLLRLVFLLYAEERDMLPEDETFLQNYSLGGLYERLREDAALLPRHDGSALRRLGAAPRALPDGPRRCRRRTDASAAAPRRALRPRSLPVPRGPVCGGSRQIHERIEAPLVPGRHDLARAREAARPRRRADLLPRARRRADRLGLRDDDGLPPRAATGRSVGDQGAEEARRADRDRPRGAAARAGAAKRDEVDSGSRRPEAHCQGRSRVKAARRSRICTPRSRRSSTCNATPDLVPARRAWCSSRARSGAAPARTTRRAR